MFAFDILSLHDKDLRKLPLLKRKDALQRALEGSQRLRPVQHVGEGGTRLYEAASALQLEASWPKKPTRRTRLGAQATG